MTEEREVHGETTESTERIPPGSMPPDDHSGSEPTDDDAAAGDPSDDDDKADQESKESFPASDPPSW